MDYSVPYSKELVFDGKVAEITTISLEHNIDVLDGELNGTFIVSGEYKAHELSVNCEPFKFDLPFFIELGDRIDEDSINFNIDDFNYEIIDENIVKINISFSVKALKKEDVIEQVRNELLDDVMEEPEIIEPDVIEESIEEIKEVNTDEDSEERVDSITQDIVEEAIVNSDEEYITYHIHIVKENETIDSICSLYNTTNNIISEYNELKDIKVGDKLIIPEDIDE